MAEKNAAGNLLGIGMDYILLFWALAKSRPKIVKNLALAPRSRSFRKTSLWEAFEQATR